MYRKQEQTPIPAENFELPVEGKLSQDNRWVMMANFIPLQRLTRVSTLEIVLIRKQYPPKGASLAGSYK